MAELSNKESEYRIVHLVTDYYTLLFSILMLILYIVFAGGRGGGGLNCLFETAHLLRGRENGFTT